MTVREFEPGEYGFVILSDLAAEAIGLRSGIAMYDDDDFDAEDSDESFSRILYVNGLGGLYVAISDFHDSYMMSADPEDIAGLRWCDGGVAKEGKRVYLMRAGKNYKIGVSKDIVKRAANLQVGCPEEITIVASTPGDEVIEKNLHHKFGEFSTRKNGEWFSLSKPDVNNLISGWARHEWRF